MNFQMLIEQLSPTDVVRTFRAFIRCSSGTVELFVVDELALAVDDVRTRAAFIAFTRLGTDFSFVHLIELIARSG